MVYSVAQTRAKPKHVPVIVERELGVSMRHWEPQFGEMERDNLHRPVRNTFKDGTKHFGSDLPGARKFSGQFRVPNSLCTSKTETFVSFIKLRNSFSCYLENIIKDQLFQKQGHGSFRNAWHSGPEMFSDLFVTPDWKQAQEPFRTSRFHLTSI